MTLVMCFLLSLMMGLFTAGIRLGREEYAGVQAAVAADTAMYSLFAGYDKDLLETYDLFFLDGGYGKGSIEIGAMLDRMDRPVQTVLQEGLPGCEDAVCGISGYRLATQQEGAAFGRQAAEAVKRFTGPALLRNMEARLHIWEKMEKEQKKTVEQGPPPMEYKEETPDPGSYTKEDNPVETLKMLRGLGILDLVLPKDQGVSEKEADVTDFLSNRTLQTGLGNAGSTNGKEGSKWLLQLYITEKMSSFTDRVGGKPLDYEVEYILNGENKDEDNLKKTVYKLLLLREASNLGFLYTSQVKRTEIHSMAITLGTIFLMPELIPVLEGVLMTGWAYVESLSDVRILLAGGRVSLKKAETDWHSDLRNLTGIFTGDSGNSGSGRGLDYKEYLTILLGFCQRKTLTFRCMDLIEQNIRLRPGKEKFQMDSCIECVDAEIVFTSPAGKSWTAARTYSYDM